MNRSTQILKLPVGDGPDWEATSVEEDVQLKGVNERSPALPTPMTGVSSASPSAPAASHSAPLLATFPSPIYVTQALVTQVNQAASSNPTLANLLQLAVAGQASADQLKTLGLLIQSLASAPSAGVDATTTSVNPAQSKTPDPNAQTMPAPSTSQYPPQAAVAREFDIVLEFREAPSDRWTFPRGPAKCEFIPLPGFAGAFGDVALTTVVPFTSTNVQQVVAGNDTASEAEKEPKEIAVFLFKAASAAVWDTISRWIGSKAEENAKMLSEIKPPERKFLAHRLPEGPELSQIQSAAVLAFSTKPIKPATENKPKRKPSRKNLASGDDPTSAATKRKRHSQTKNQAPSQMACLSCGQTDVPLIKGGRYCRPCVNAGKTGDTPQTAPLTPGDQTTEKQDQAPSTTQASTVTHNPSPENVDRDVVDRNV
ncbi:hypothetical protein ID866_6910 [Astraeus odoratus]|nr:hypothetical protein ID866_6910 [Astraeus odoratus]